MYWSWLKKVLALAGIFAPIQAVAILCGPVFSMEYGAHGRVEIKPSAQHGPKATEYAKILEHVDGLLGPLSPATSSVVSVDNIFIFSVFDPTTFRISVGLRPARMGAKHPAHNFTTLIHEYGHAVFETNMLLRNKSFQKLFADFSALEKSSELMDLSSHKLTPYWNLRGAFHELFADVVTLAATKDPKALHNVLRDSRESYDKISELLLRDFSDGRHGEARRLWKNAYQQRVIEEGDIYFALLPARWEIWKLARNHIKSENYQRNLIPAVYEVLEKHYMQILESGNPQELGRSGFDNIEVINQRLIEDLQKALD
ncbi:hypothetical protein EZJ49_05910 [Bdellovibrio bacteriovorus]|uniref:hypothetical protein n=1 Tax=Bdellovibrio bacteriovorus TaxID=959 RepID=UPI0021D2F421|nr:hypothetical protein [Bdellovibrio bacteriovorus]UXR65783.1 hypothetical protein EZJ49_05910 [Bdellovibrio bacteriovorus]